jgi:hypothetical protein
VTVATEPLAQPTVTPPAPPTVIKTATAEADPLRFHFHGSGSRRVNLVVRGCGVTPRPCERRGRQARGGPVRRVGPNRVW